MAFAKCKGCRKVTRLTRAVLSTALVFGGSATVVALGAEVANAATCVSAGSTGLTAAVVATSNISGGTINATGCDIGIYVPPGTSGVTITGVNVYGANDHGIFVQDANSITISNSTVQGNGVDPTTGILENKAIQLVGTSNSKVTGNTVTNNYGDGGISVTDDGPINPGAPAPGGLKPANNDTVSSNTVNTNYKGYAIVFAAYNATAGVSGGTVSSNTLTGTKNIGPRGPVIGGVVIDTNRPGTSVTNMTVTGNSISDQAVSGITLDSNGTGSTMSGVSVTNNTLSGNDWLPAYGPPASAGIVLEATPVAPTTGPLLTSIAITGNTISGSYYGIWINGATAVVTSPNTITTTGGAAVYTVPSPGAGYWVCTADGGVFTFGQARFFGSMGGRHLAAQVVGMAPTPDQGGYWLVGADGGVFSFGNANFYGSMAGKHLRSPIVGIVATPDGHGYWMVGADGGVFTFGDAGFYGSMAQVRLAAQIVGIVPTPDGHGYWMVGADGGVFTFGDAGFYGSMAQVRLAAQIVGIVPSPDGLGYWLLGADGGVFTFGDAHFYGSMHQYRHTAAITCMARVGFASAS